MKLKIVAMAIACCLGGIGIGGLVSPRVTNPPSLKTYSDVSITPLSPESKLIGERSGGLVANSVSRHAQEITVRVRNFACDGSLYSGSGYILNNKILITNRHVVAGAITMEVDTWDGHSFHVKAAGAARLGDIGIVQISSGNLPRRGIPGPLPHKKQGIIVAGYPLGGALTLTRGKIVDFVNGRPFGVDGRVMRITAQIKHGNSGGPVMDGQGRVIGIVFAIEIKSGLGLAIPLSSISSIVRRGGFGDVPGCVYR
jgi:S1-C subfamily serine protease